MFDYAGMLKVDYMVQARGLAKRFPSRAGGVEAVRSVDIDVGTSEIAGFLGPNGAGKTTTLRMLTTLLSPSAGNATVAGHDLRREPVAVRRRSGTSRSGAAPRHRRASARSSSITGDSTDCPVHRPSGGGGR
jgi:ABC-type Na+ transport system ATPase subunit NatA